MNASQQKLRKSPFASRRIGFTALFLSVAVGILAIAFRLETSTSIWRLIETLPSSVIAILVEGAPQEQLRWWLSIFLAILLS